MKTAEFGVPCAAPQPGTCRICGCTEDRACVTQTDGSPNGTPCGWADHTRTLCDNRNCVAAAKRELGLVP